MTVALDCDGVLVDVIPLICDEWWEAGITINGRRARRADVTEWDHRLIPGISDPKRAYAIAWRVFGRADLYDGLAPIPGVNEALEALRARWRVIAVSGPTIGHADSKLRFLRALGFRHVDVVLTGDKMAVEWDALVDDAPRNARQAMAAGRRIVMLRQPWNARLSEFDAVRVDNWQHVLSAIDACRTT